MTAAQGSPGSDASNPIFIAVMGITGAGKSYFIRQVTRDAGVVIGDEITSCTQEIRIFAALIDGLYYALIDTPGFNDTNYEDRSDVDALTELANWLDHTYKKNMKLSGIIYLHPLINNRMDGASLRSLNMFRKLCGDDNLRNVILATTHWADVPEEKAAKREEELANKFWKRLIDEQARMTRYLGDYDSGIAILRTLSHSQRMTLEIQRETVEQGKNIAQTAAGQVVNQELLAARARHEKEMEILRKDLAERMDLKDAQSAKERDELTEEMAKLQNRLAKNEEDQEKLEKPVWQKVLEVSLPLVFGGLLKVL